MRIDFSRMITAELRHLQDERTRLHDTLASAQAKLSDTDWMVIRASEGGAPLPDSIRAARAEARAQISALRTELARLPDDVGNPV
ncbi:MAG: hypothetical protein ACK4HW_00490 [Roseinatronobacter sp.]